MSSSRYDCHGILINLMLRLGYISNDIGVCNGITMMALQACATGDIVRFNERLAYIQANPNILSDINEVKRKLAQRSLAAESPKQLLLMSMK